ncbi:MAG: hypothetical protein CM15mP29_3350 [Alphaproteobacteria bacterium]|nr:MAG: hypothetical protein CM15mP29_3350 [Alphaproteobacteria bacterium]
MSENTYDVSPEKAYKRLKIRSYDIKTRAVTYQLALWREKKLNQIIYPEEEF